VAVAVAVGQDEDPLAAVGRTHVARLEAAPLRIEPQRGQVTEDDVESSNKESADVLHEDEVGSHLANDADVLAPETRARALDDAGPLARGADVLAGEASNDEIHAATPRAAVEGAHVRPDRRVIQDPPLHARCQDRGCVGFPLHVADRASDSSAAESKVDPADAGEEADGT
jgi:hypothetical protein